MTDGEAASGAGRRARPDRAGRRGRVPAHAGGPRTRSIAGRGSRYVQLATAAPEGAASLVRWRALGRDAAGRLGVEQVVVDVRRPGHRRRSRAPRPGRPRRVDLPVRRQSRPPDPRAARDRGLDGDRRGPAGGRGAGRLQRRRDGAVGDPVRRPASMAAGGRRAGLVPMVEVLPHFDRFASWMPDLVVRRVAGAPAGVQVVGIDEDTTLVGGRGGWE